jgi:hypothetical protein
MGSETLLEIWLEPQRDGRKEEEGDREGLRWADILGTEYLDTSSCEV